MNILIFSPVKIYPVDAGSRVRIYNLTNHLIKLGHTVHFVYYSVNGVDKIHFDFMQNMCDSFTCIVKKKKTELKEGNYILDQWYEDSIEKKVNELVDFFKIDTILTNYIFHCKFLESLPENVYKIIDTHDRFTDRYKLFSNQKDIKYTWHSYSKEDEAKALNRADIVIAITDEENKYFSSITHSKVLTLGHIENKKQLEKDNKTLTKIGFIGGGNQVNKVAINNFLELFYKTSNNTDMLKIVLAGKICEHIKVKHKNIELLGLVKDLDQFYNNIDLIINPLLFGTGQKIKSIEAISFGVPLVSTKVGFEGIYSDYSFHQLNSISEMVEAIDKIVEQPTLLKTLKQQSLDIFDSYSMDIDTKVQKIFKQRPSHIISKDKLLEYKEQTRKELDEMLIQMYQNKIKKQNNIIKTQKTITKKYETILKEIKEITKISFLKHPIKKYKQYKNILKAYYGKY